MLNSHRGLFVVGLLLYIIMLSGSVSPIARTQEQQQQQRPNIVLMFPDNLGWGEVGVYGSVRGVPTPNIDRIVAEYEASTKVYPNVPRGTKDPYTPPKRKR